MTSLPVGSAADEVPAETIWAYSYEFTPPQPEVRLRAIKTLLEQEHLEATSDARKWEGRLVVSHEVTHILVVSDSPDQDREVNRRLAAALRNLEAAYSITVPLGVAEETEVPSALAPPRPERRKKRR